MFKECEIGVELLLVSKQASEDLALELWWQVEHTAHIDAAHAVMWGKKKLFQVEQLYGSNLLSNR